MFHLLLDRAISRLLPPTCVLCGATGTAGLDLCAGCLTDLPHNRQACPRCALPMPPGQEAGSVCGPCQRHPPPYATCHVPFLYLDPMTALVRGAKFHGRLNLTRLLGLCLARHLHERGADRPELIIPVPLHPRRMRERGYNQALEMALALSRELAIPVDPSICARVRAITPQEGLDREERRRNVRGAFAIDRPLAAHRVAILDDVVTTGSTAAEVARVLHQAGAERVDLWAVARTP